MQLEALDKAFADLKVELDKSGKPVKNGPGDTFSSLLDTQELRSVLDRMVRRRPI